MYISVEWSIRGCFIFQIDVKVEFNRFVITMVFEKTGKRENLGTWLSQEKDFVNRGLRWCPKGETFRSMEENMPQRCHKDATKPRFRRCKRTGIARIFLVLEFLHTRKPVSVVHRSASLEQRWTELKKRTEIKTKNEKNKIKGTN